MSRISFISGGNSAMTPVTPNEDDDDDEDTQTLPAPDVVVNSPDVPADGTDGGDHVIFAGE